MTRRFPQAPAGVHPVVRGTARPWLIKDVESLATLHGALWSISREEFSEATGLVGDDLEEIWHQGWRRDPLGYLSCRTVRSLDETQAMHNLLNLVLTKVQELRR